MKPSLLALAERCEKAMGPDEALDVAIVYGLYPDIGNYEGQCIGDEPIFWHEPYRKQPCPKFTASLDAAMTLVPEGWNVQFERTGKSARACVWKAARNHSRYCATPALALCAAALRASNTNKEQEQ